MKFMANSQNSPLFTEHGIPIRNLWHMLLYAWNEPSLQNQVSMGDVEQAPTLDSLLALILIRLLEQRLRIGLGRGYVEETERLRRVRGKVNFAESLKQQTFERGEAISDFQQYSANEPRNQILRSTLRRLVQVGEFGTDQAAAEVLRHRLRRLVRSLHGVDLVELTPELVRRQQFAQNENDYLLMLSVCELVVLRQMPLEQEGAQPLPRLDRDAMILHRVYERFVANFYRLHLTDWEVNAQKLLDWHAPETNEHLPSMVPDLILREHASGQIVILDTKFTAASLIENQWGKPIYDSSHLYQLYAYLRSQEELSAAHRTAAGILLYPAVKTHLSDRVELQGHTVRIECVDLAAEWQEVERQLMKVVKGD
jgi:5-methylcytosine-specific restriction enzyme subunit McrC